MLRWFAMFSPVILAILMVGWVWLLDRIEKKR